MISNKSAVDPVQVVTQGANGLDSSGQFSMVTAIVGLMLVKAL